MSVRSLRSLPTLLVIFAAIAAFVIYREAFIYDEAHAFQAAPIDLQVYRLAGQQVASGGNLYDGDFIPGLPFTYPPFAGMIFSWFASWSTTATTWGWQGLNFFSMVAVIAMVFGTKVRAGFGVWLLAVLIAISSFGLDSIHGSFFYGQINPLLMLLVALDFLPKRNLGGIGVGLAAGLKLTPAFFVIVFLAQKRYLAALTSFITFLATVALGFATIPDASRFWTNAISDSSRVGEHTNPGAQSLRSVMLRVFGVDNMAAWLVAAIITVVLIWVGLRYATKHHSPAVAMSLAGIGACLISPFTWFHHWVWVVPAMACLIVWVDGLATRASSGLVRQASAFVGAGAVVAITLPQLTWIISKPLNFFSQADYPDRLYNAAFSAVGAAIIVGYVAFNVALTLTRRFGRKAVVAGAASAVAPS
ncbi:glycosyltransferase 87 family protein [Corynebacterium vitaeruminis]|uniref:Polyprenol-phosphate-mannose-dependent alpha-(1-2)-phosphatidylinositol mannoside mannosyltransferase n=1 Tax=Corynebacterium vitaeruminis DSM 20294 TaxID=1224164 RepID=W5YAT2_9CORY|nr:glycosyltransferase 87 family protein [Corynebacterium vitaeruminis]AHI23648.1 hypothetical protein B843_11350 [Corynebacterium vitaeruminis DSM 20294]